MHKTLLDILACPICGGSLLHNKEQQALICTTDQVAYPIKNEIPIMMVNKAQKLSKEDINSIQ